MSTPQKACIPGASRAFRDERQKEIEEILSRGKVVKFTNPFTEQVKYVDTWNPDIDGDLIAFYWKGNAVPYVAWDSHRYDIAEVDRSEVPAL